MHKGLPYALTNVGEEWRSAIDHDVPLIFVNTTLIGGLAEPDKWHTTIFHFKRACTTNATHNTNFYVTHVWRFSVRAKLRQQSAGKCIHSAEKPYCGQARQQVLCREKIAFVVTLSLKSAIWDGKREFF